MFVVLDATATFNNKYIYQPIKTTSLDSSER